MSFTSDVSSAWKGLRAGRWASVTAVIALSVGIAASATSAALAWSGLMRPLPFPRGDELFTLRQIHAPTKGEFGVKLAEFSEWSERLASTCRLAAWATERVTLRGDAGPIETQVTYTLGPFLETLGAQPEAGRLLFEDDRDAGVISHRFAVRLADDARLAVGRTFAIRARTIEVVGVLPVAFSTVSPHVDLWTNARGIEALRIAGDADVRDYTMIGRLAVSRSLADVVSQARRVQQDLRVNTPGARNWNVIVRPLRDVLIADARPVLLGFVAASALVLLVACANVCMLMVNRAIGRGREFAVRLALGSSRLRLFRTLAIETTMISVAGAAGGWLLGTLGARWLEHETAFRLPSVATMEIAGPVAVGVAAVGLFVAIVCAVAPIAALGPSQVALALRSSRTTASPTSRRIRAALVVAQFAMAMVLLTGAGLLGRALIVLWHADIGVDNPDRVVALRIPIGESTRAGAASRLLVIDELLTRTRQLPGVVAAGVGATLPPSTTPIKFSIRVLAGSRDETATFDLAPVTDGYLEATGARVLAGRLFRPDDAARDEAVAVISERAMRHLGRTTDIVGRELNVRLPSASGARVAPKVVGIIRDIRYTGLETPASGGVYVLWRQLPLGQAYLVARSSGDPTALAPTLTQLARSIDPSLPLASAVSLDEEIDRALAPRSSRFELAGIFAVAAALLAIVGLGGVMIHSVMERQRELAIRAAIGATPGSLVRSFVWRGLIVAAIGVAIGASLSLAAGRAIASLLTGVSAYDPVTYALAIAAMLLIAAVTSYLAARRSASADPMMLLRAE